MLGLLVAGMLIQSSVQAYEVETHMAISDYAVRHSVLLSKVEDLGFESVTQVIPDFTRYKTYVVPFLSPAYSCRVETNAVANKTISMIVQGGSFCEDATFEDGFTTVRYFQHFFDPSNGGAGISGFASSLTWAREPAPTQNFSYQDAREFFFRAMTWPDELVRKRQLALAFRSLGHFVHLVQDLGQPQHTRADSHGGGSVYEQYVNSNIAELLSDDELSDYDPSQIRISDLDDLWTTLDRKGLADFSNLNFVTEDTNFRGSLPNIQPDPDYAEPSGANAVINQVSIETLGSECPGPIPSYLHGNLIFISTPVHDYVTDTTETNQRTSSYGIWSNELDAAGFKLKFSFNRFNACASSRFLAKRAAAYSIAAINYFFRGKLVVTAPPSGLYSLIDHSTISGTDPNTNFTGFSNIRVIVGNETAPRPGESGHEPMGAGTLYARFWFHRNTCYADDLSGQHGLGMDPIACRSAQQEFVDSIPVQVDLSVSPQEVEFVFNQGELPINATDVRLQIIYRGSLGSEENALAFTSVDVSEPGFLTYFNLHDYIKIEDENGIDKVWTREQVNNSATLLSKVQPPSCVDFTLNPAQLKPACFNPDPISKTFTFGTALLPSVQITSLPASRYIRIAFLGEGQPVVNALAPQITAPSSGDCSSAASGDLRFNAALYTLATDPISGQLLLYASPLASLARGVASTSRSGCVWVGDGDPFDLSGTHIASMGNVPPQNLLPVPVQISMP